MTEISRLDDALRAAAQGDLEEEARLLLALAHGPDGLAAAYARGRLLSETPRLIRGLIARLGKFRAEAASASASRPLSADDLDTLPVGTRVTTKGGSGHAVKIAAGRWVTDMAAPLTATATSQDIASAGVTAMRIPLHPPAPMPWHTDR